MFTPDHFLSERELNHLSVFRTPAELWTTFINPVFFNSFSFPKGRVLFRGQTDARNGISSTLYRSVSEQINKLDYINGNSKKQAENLLSDAEINVLNYARKSGLTRHLSDIQVLALLQHHGSPTRLIDVTKSPLVALFFAVEKHDSLDGRVFLVSPRPENIINSRVTGKALWSNIQGSFSEWSTKVWNIDIDNLDSRMVSQEGTFLVGGLYTSGGKYPAYPRNSTVSVSASEFRKVSSLAINFPAKDLHPYPDRNWSAYGWSIKIPSSWKEELRENLNQLEINFDTIYPPVNELSRLLQLVAVNSAVNHVEVLKNRK